MHVKEIQSDAFHKLTGQNVAFAVKDAQGNVIALFTKEALAIDYSGMEGFPKKKEPVAWIGVDLDGTAALIDKSHGFVVGHIGEPIPMMSKRIKGWLAQGICVKICTARVATDGTKQGNIHAGINRRYIEAWTLKHFKVELEVVSGKDYYMVELWDDRAISIGCNEGNIVHRTDRCIEGVDV